MTESNDLGQAMISLVRDLEPSLLILVTALCYLLALMALAQGLLRLLKTSEDKFHAPSAGGTALSFLLCIVLAALPAWLDAAGESLFGTANPPGTASLGYRGRGADYDALLAAVFALVALVGLFAFIRAPSCCAPPPTPGPARAALAPSPTWEAASPPGTSAP